MSRWQPAWILACMAAAAVGGAACSEGGAGGGADARPRAPDGQARDAAWPDRGADMGQPRPDQTPTSGTELRGETTSGHCSALANAPVKDPLAALNKLSSDGLRMGFSLGAAPTSHAGSFDHWQGIQRLGCGKPYVVVSRSNKDTASPDFVVVHLGSQAKTGLAWASNLLGVFKDVPDARDRVVVSSAVPAAQGGFSNLKYRHAGGMQLVGDTLAVPFENPSAGLDGYVAFYDLAAPTKPKFRHALRIKSTDRHLGAAGMVRLQDGTYLLVVVNDAWSRTLLFYRSSARRLGADPGFSRIGAWKLSGASKAGWVDSWWGRYQSINLIADAKGALYMVATGNNFVAGVGQDWADLYRLKVTPGAPGAAHSVRLIKVGKRRLKPGQQAVPPRDYGSFDAAAGAYVAQDGSLYIYATEAANSLPKVSGAPSVGMSQFAP